MGARRLIYKVLQDGARKSIYLPGISFSSSVRMASSVPNPMETSRSSSGLLNSTADPNPRGSRADGELWGGRALFRSQNDNFAGAMGMDRRFHSCSWTRSVGLHSGRTFDAHPTEPTYGVGPVGGADRDPETKGSTPDDFRADGIHMAEPKEIAKEKAAVAQGEPPDFQVKKMMPQWKKPVEEKADSQSEPGDKVFEGNTRKVEGTAEKQGNTTGNESGEKMEGQYGAVPEEGKTSRA